LTSCSVWGALTTFPYKLRQVFIRPGGAPALCAPLAMTPLLYSPDLRSRPHRTPVARGIAFWFRPICCVFLHNCFWMSCGRLSVLQCSRLLGNARLCIDIIMRIAWNDKSACSVVVSRWRHSSLLHNRFPYCYHSNCSHRRFCTRHNNNSSPYVTSPLGLSNSLQRLMECRRGSMRILSVLSVRPSVCPSNACIVTKRKKNLSRFLYHAKDHLA